MKSLIIKKPDDPIEYLIKKLSEPECNGVRLIIFLEKKIFIIGPPGSKVRELALSLTEYFKFNFVSVGDLLIKELSKKSPLVFINYLYYLVKS
jgi:adenylate kinase